MLNDSINNILASINLTPLTPFNICLDMISLLDDKGFFDKPADSISMEEYINSHRVCDFYCKSGDLLSVCYFKFVKALSDKFKTPEELDYFIWRHLLYAICSSTDIAYMLTKKFYGSNKLFESDGSVLGHFYVSSMIEERDVENHVPEELKDMKFDVVVGNPPYNKDIYLEFVKLGFSISNMYSLWITPAKWQSKGGSLNEEIRNLVSDKVSDLVFYPDTKDVFPEVALDGGVVYYLVNVINPVECSLKNIQGNTVTSMVTNKLKVFDLDLQRILNKIDGISILDSSLFSPEKSYFSGRETADPHLIIDNSSKYRLINQKRNIGVPESDCKHLEDIDKYKCYATHYMNASTTYFKLNPYEFSTRGNILLYFGTEFECDSALSYYTTKLIRYICIKTGLGSVCKECFMFVPAPEAFDHIFTDEELYKKYNLSSEEISIIESVVGENIK